MTRIEYMLFFLARFVNRQEIAGLCQRLGRFPAGTGASPPFFQSTTPARRRCWPRKSGVRHEKREQPPSIAGHGIFASPRAGNCGLLDVLYTVLGRQLEGTLQRAETANGSSPLDGLPVLVQAKSQHESLDMAASLMQAPVPSFPSPCL